MKHDEQVTVLLGEIGMTVLEKMHAETHWRQIMKPGNPMPLATRCSARPRPKRIPLGIENARAAIAEAPRVELPALGQYDA